MQNPSCRHGFTLIELSIVLVIIGLLAAGILVGQDLIHAAELRATVAQIETFKTSVNTFRLKYDCLPGDCASALAFGLGTAGGPGDNGDNNGILYDTDPDPGAALLSLAHESYNFWYHLSRANLVAGNFPGWQAQTTAVAGVDFPETKLGKGGIWISPAVILDHNGIAEVLNGHNPPRTNSFWLASIDTSVPFFINGALQPLEAYQIDTKLDDGMPLSGSVTITASTGNAWRTLRDTISGPLTYGPGGANSNFCGSTDTTPPSYNLVNTSNHPRSLCVMEIRAGF
jgi:prepilin-type N-terminal cleavage/methylation domain-containing protein